MVTLPLVSWWLEDPKFNSGLVHYLSCLCVLQLLDRIAACYSLPQWLTCPHNLFKSVETPTSGDYVERENSRSNSYHNTWPSPSTGSLLSWWRVSSHVFPWWKASPLLQQMALPLDEWLPQQISSLNESSSPWTTGVLPQWLVYSNKWSLS